jgi:chemotaxis protein CheD
VAFKTIVGSCVSVCLWDPEAQVGGMNHYLLPHSVGPRTGNLRYGGVAIPALVDAVEDLGAKRPRLRAKLYGGGCVIREFLNDPRAHLGSRNVVIANELLTELGIKVVERDVGGQHGRKIVFYPQTGLSSVSRT